MKFLKGITAVALTVAVLAFAAFMFVPMDSYIAQKSAEMKGYEVAELLTDAEYRYYYNRLGENEQFAYRLILAAITDFPDEIIVPKLTDEELANVFEAISYDNPEFFFLSNKCSLTSIGSINYFIPQYLMVKSDYQNRMAEVDAKVSHILDSLESCETQYDKELYIHDYISKNCVYSESGSNMVFTMYGLLVEGRANCEGYSRAAQYIMKRAGIENRLVTGTAIDVNGESEGHMWNIVNVDGEYYNLDITWDDYTLNNTIESPDNEPSHMYFNLPSSKMSVTHTADDESTWAECVLDFQNYYVKSGLMYSACNSSAEASVRQAIARALMSGSRSLEIAFDNTEGYNKAVDYFITDRRMYNILRAANAVAPSSNRINPNKIQYTKDDDKLVIRFFLSK